MGRTILFVLFILFISCRFGLTNQVPRKQLAGPPSEFQNHRIPTPHTGAQLQQSAYFEYNYQYSEDLQCWVWKQDLLVDSPELFSFAVYSSSNFRVELLNPNGNAVDVDQYKQNDFFPIGETLVPGTVYQIPTPSVGTWKLTLRPSETEDVEKFLNSDVPHGSVMLWNESPLRMYTRLDSYNLKLTDDVGLVTMITQQSQTMRDIDPISMRDVIVEANMDVEMPDGSVVDVNMHDDGLFGDAVPDDGIYIGVLPAAEAGIYKAQAVLKGQSADGTQFIRTTQHIIPVVDSDIQFTGQATGMLQDAERMQISIGLATQMNLSNSTYRAYAEVYGVNSTGGIAPACWLSSLVDVTQGASGSSVALQLNLRWLNIASLKAPLTLQTVYLQEINAFVPVAQIAQIPVTIVNQNKVNELIEKLVTTEITSEMRKGRRYERSNVTAPNPKLVVTHGYCAEDNPFAKFPEDWTNAIFFENPNANIRNDEFAKLLLAFANQNGATSFGLVAHSQGGMASLHLLNYYDTPLEDAQGPRLIQTVGTPYHGSSGGGTASSLGQIFGVGCGSAFDLTLDGAALWYAGITQESQQQVYYYTTTYSLNSSVGDYCSWLTNSVLEWPNDGAVELVNAQLEFGNSMGNTEQECHTTGMKYEAQYWDRTRNHQINANAAR